MDKLEDEELEALQHKEKVRKIRRRNYACKELIRRTGISFLDCSCHTPDEIKDLRNIINLINQLREKIRDNTNKYYKINKNSKSRTVKYDVNKIKL